MTNAPVRLYCALVVRKALEDTVLPSFRGSHPEIAVEEIFDPTTVLRERIEAGERPDVLVAVTGALAPILATGAVAEETQEPFVRSAIGVAVAEGAPRPDISTTEALVATLSGARSVAYSRAGASGIYFVELLDQLGIADLVNSRATVLPKGFTAEAVVDGRADLAVQQLSELSFVKGVDVVAPLPDEVQQYTDFTIALGADAAHRPEARTLATFLRGEIASQAYAADGLTMIAS
ncbi:substrate-binding domain-containing protein [Saccharomonospora sp. NPDC046836]|uniref:molybdate ABC transporter substrate-binding protein n=1 Tax=Saccharomonospora sp. NPDC046836 TaxID=3156921 RepID=UPI0033EB7BF9